MKVDLRQGSSGPILFPARHDPNAPHHPIDKIKQNIKNNLPQLEMCKQSVWFA